MLRTNSRAARENLQRYITESVGDYLQECAAYDGKKIDLSSFHDVAAAIYETFCNEFKPGYYSRRGIPENETFCNYAQGLPCGALFDYYLHSAVKTLGDILQETDAERSRFTETDAENMLTILIYREIKKAL